MSVALRIIEDKPLTRADFASSKIVSLWDMERIFAEHFVQACSRLGRVQGVLDRLKKQYEDVTSIPRPPLHDDLVCARDASMKMGLEVVTDRISELIDFLDGNHEIDLKMLVHMIDRLPKKLANELRKECLLRMEPDHVQFWDDGSAFLGKDIVKKLRKIKQEADEAGRCFALEEYTACAFHLMRIMEHIVHRFAVKMRLTFDPDEDSWGQILERAWQKIMTWDKKSPNFKNKKKYSACYKQMDGMRPWRNNIMHPKEWYTKERVQELNGAVKLCIRDFLKLPDLAS